jgi:hypothetical protein
MLPPYDVVIDAAAIARRLANQFRRAGEPLRAAYFDRVADEADARADRLLNLEASGPGLRRILSSIASERSIESAVASSARRTFRE